MKGIEFTDMDIKKLLVIQSVIDDKKKGFIDDATGHFLIFCKQNANNVYIHL